jgi:hypothetical protein
MASPGGETQGSLASSTGTPSRHERAALNVVPALEHDRWRVMLDYRPRLRQRVLAGDGSSKRSKTLADAFWSSGPSSKRQASLVFLSLRRQHSSAETHMRAPADADGGNSAQEGRICTFLAGDPDKYRSGEPVDLVGTPAEPAR